MHYFAALIRPPMVGSARQLTQNIHHQRATERDVEHLMAAANRQQRFALAESFIPQDYFAQIPLPTIRSHVYGPLEPGREPAAVDPRVHILAAGEQNTVATADALGNCLARGRGRQSNRQATGSQERLLI